MRTSNRKQAVLFSTGGQEYIELLSYVFFLKIHISHLLFISAEITNLHIKENMIALSLADPFISRTKTNLKISHTRFLSHCTRLEKSTFFCKLYKDE